MKRHGKKHDERYEFEPSDEDYELLRMIDKENNGKGKGNVEVTMWEIPKETPRMVLLCSEETNWFTVLNAKRQEKYGRREGVGEISLLVVTITIHDDLNSDYGFHKASLSLRDNRDSMFFAGPCTGGSSWARLNRGKGPQTEAIIEAKVLIFKQLWGRFEILFVTFYDRRIRIYMELPRGCQYWNNEEVRFMIEGTDSTIHDFDGCCYGLRQKFGESNLYIKKPWRIVSWNVELGNKLSLRCDGRHEHTPCAGRETLHTQIYTSKIVSIVLEEQHRRSICSDRDSITTRTAGSSGSMNKKCVVAASCTKMNSTRNEKQREHSCQRSPHSRVFHFTFNIILSKKSSKKGLRWNTASLSVKHQELTKGLFPTGATGAARAGSSGGHKTCSAAMAASGSNTRPQTEGDRPKLFALDDDTNGIRYLKTTGEIMNTLIEEEGRGNITLPTRFGHGVTSPSLVESWAALGIPLVFLLGMRLGEIATEKDAIIPSFKRIIRLARSEDMSLDLNDAVVKSRRICQAICVATETFVGRGETQDLYTMKPILNRLSTAQQLRESGRDYKIC